MIPISIQSADRHRPRALVLGLALRAAGATAILGPWLVVLTSLQTPLFPAPEAPVPNPIPSLVVIAAIAAVAVARALVPTTIVHVLFLAVATCGVATLAAQVGEPLASATAIYCGDRCRTAIMARFLAFFGWPVVMAIALAVAGRRERSGRRDGASSRAAWSYAWAGASLVLGIAAAVAWWQIILPNG